MIEMAIRAFTTFFATVGPVDVAALYAALTVSATPRQRRAMAVKGVVIATVILVLFTLLGKDVLHWMGVTLPAVRTAGGILLLMLSIDMVFARHSGITWTTSAETAEAEGRGDISVFPLATPLIAGPAAMGAAVLLASEAEGDLLLELTVLVALLAVMALTLGLLLVAAQLQRFLGVTGQNVITRVVGVLLAALAVQFIFDGIAASGLI
ncbi:MAG: NAAT family transporter [Rhodospirillales bacterium]|nr:MAG: NAAT family transporter [Rhodospirillales bacterium]